MAGHTITIELEKLKQGDMEAAEIIWSHCQDRLLRYVSKRLPDHLQRAAGPLDVVHDALTDFLQGMAEGKYGPDRIKDRTELLKWLTVMVRNLALKQIRKEVRSLGESALSSGSESGMPGGMEQAAVELNMPDFSVELADEIDQITRRIQEKDPQNEFDLPHLFGRYVHYCRQGDDQKATELIANETELSQRTIQRRLKLIREICSDPSESSSESRSIGEG